MVQKNTLSLFLFIVICTHWFTPNYLVPAPKTYDELNWSNTPFVTGFGVSLSIIDQTANNTAHPKFISKQLQMLAQKSTKPYAFFKNKNRIWYLLGSLSYIICNHCNKTFKPDQLDLQDDKKLIENIIKDITTQTAAQELTITKCPECSAPVTIQPKAIEAFTHAHRQAMIDQINFIGLKNQKGCKKGLPPYRLSIEACDVMCENSTDLDPMKIATQANWLAQLGNPFLFLHHYANPQSIPNLFEEAWHYDWFANYCTEIIKASPNIHYICPISQPLGFSFRITRQNLPPFTSALSQSKLFQNMIQAHIAAYDAIKKTNPKAQVFISHQWKVMVPKHSAPDPRYYFEMAVCAFAHKKYNQAFIDELKKHTDKFDGIALSIYSTLYFNLWEPFGDNYNGSINSQHSLECITEIYKAFPNKPIVIIETGCNNDDPEVRKTFMDMTLVNCLQARQLGIKLLGVYFWGHTNHPDFCHEWNTKPGSTYFGMFDGLDPQDPNGSINPAGEYLKEIVRPR